jgi:hypothetical protein
MIATNIHYSFLTTYTTITNTLLQDGLVIEIKDPLAATLNTLARECLADIVNPKPVPFLLEVHGEELVAQTGFVNEIVEHLQSLVRT